MAGALALVASVAALACNRLNPYAYQGLHASMTRHELRRALVATGHPALRCTVIAATRADECTGTTAGARVFATIDRPTGRVAQLVITQAVPTPRAVVAALTATNAAWRAAERFWVADCWRCGDDLSQHHALLHRRAVGRRAPFRAEVEADEHGPPAIRVTLTNRRVLDRTTETLR